jgi:hypothetical protein
MPANYARPFFGVLAMDEVPQSFGHLSFVGGSRHGNHRALASYAEAANHAEPVSKQHLRPMKSKSIQRYGLFLFTSSILYTVCRLILAAVATRVTLLSLRPIRVSRYARSKLRRNAFKSGIE